VLGVFPRAVVSRRDHDPDKIFTGAVGIRYYFVFTFIFAAVIIVATVIGAIRNQGHGYYPILKLSKFWRGDSHPRDFADADVLLTRETPRSSTSSFNQESHTRRTKSKNLRIQSRSIFT
jgi:hypothetical protein